MNGQSNTVVQFRFQYVAIFLFSLSFFFSSSQTVCFRSLKQSRNRLFSSFSIAENFHQAQLSNRSFTAYVANIRLFFHIFFFISTKACRSVQYLLRVFSLATGNFSFFLSFLFSFFLFFFLFFDRLNQLQRRDFGKVSAVERSRDSRRRVVGPAKLSAYFVPFVNDSAERLRVCVKIKTKEIKKKKKKKQKKKEGSASGSILSLFVSLSPVISICWISFRVSMTIYDTRDRSLR